MSGRIKLVTNEEIISKSIGINKVSKSNINETHKIKAGNDSSNAPNKGRKSKYSNYFVVNDDLKSLRLKNRNKFIIAHLNINFIRNKFDLLKEQI